MYMLGQTAREKVNTICTVSLVTTTLASSRPHLSRAVLAIARGSVELS